jgi:ribosomal protein S3AE
MAKSKKNLKRSFYEVTSPTTSTKIQLYSTSKESLIGQTIKLDLTRNLRGKSLILKLKIKKSKDNLTAIPISLELAGSYIRRMIRKGTDYVEDSFHANSKDSSLVIKPFLITRNKVSRGVRKTLRKTAKKHLESHLKIRSTSDLLTEIMTNKLQKELSLKLKKIYPLALCEIRAFQILGESKPDTSKPKEQAPLESTSDTKEPKINKKEESSSTPQTSDNKEDPKKKMKEKSKPKKEPAKLKTSDTKKKIE